MANHKSTYSHVSLFSTVGLIEESSARSPVCGEQAIWRAVILQALEDAVNRSPKTQHRYEKEQALRWLTERNPDFVLVCDYAGWDPDYVRRKVKKALLNGCKWRAESKQKQSSTKGKKQDLPSDETKVIPFPTIRLAV